jgi:alginate O-acetyltransferase complex protein AlgI
MPGSTADLVARLAHVGGLVFTEFAAVGLLVALVVWVADRRLGAAAREALVLAASLGVLAWFVSPAVAAACVGFAVLFHALVERVPGRWAVAAGVVLLLAAMVVLPVVLIAPLGAAGRHAREFVAFGTNMAILRFAAYAHERRRGTLPAQPLPRFLLAMFFFPTFVNGPVEPPSRLLRTPWPAAAPGDLGAGLARLAGGCAKLLVVGLGLPPGWTGVLAQGPHAPAWQLWAWSGLLYLWFYLTFSAWSDVAIGLARLCGHRAVENFDRPWLALHPADFWHRWHVSFGVWLRDHVYIPLGGNRRHRALNVVVTFAVSAAWHVWGTLKLLGFGYYPVAAWGGLFTWGALHAAGVLVFSRVRPAGRWVTVARAATFLFAAWAWLPFFLPGGVSLAEGLGMLARMLWPLAGALP